MTDDGAVDLHPLLKRAHAIAVDRAEQYGEWRSTARNFCSEDLAEYPRVMIKAKFARDPDLRHVDTLVDVINYLGMLFELEAEGRAEWPESVHVEARLPDGHMWGTRYTRDQLERQAFLLKVDDLEILTGRMLFNDMVNAGVAHQKDVLRFDFEAGEWIVEVLK